MKSKNILTLTFAFLSLMALGQRSAMELTFTAVNINAHVQLDSVKIMNRTQGGDTVLYYPDTVLVLYFTGIPEPQPLTSDFMVFQNYPNPMTDQTTISLYVPEKDRVSIIVTDLLGRETLKSERVLDRGNHNFRFSPGSSSLYFFTAQWKGRSSSIKILQASSGLNSTCSLDYIGSHVSTSQLKTSEDIFDFTYSDGDELLYIGYADTLQSGMLDVPETSETYTFQFATNIPCEGTPTVSYEGQVYNTIQIFSQCWLKENLNVGTLIQGFQNMADNSVIEKYCYNNNPDSCAKYGGLYQWNEMMQYTTQQGVQGICPPGWHLPNDEEWKVLEGVIDSQYRIGDSVWDINRNYRGYDAGAHLKTTGGWFQGGNGTDLYGFSGPPGGYCYNGPFYSIGYYGDWWTSTEVESDYAFYRDLSYIHSKVSRYDDGIKEGGLNVRCLRNEIYFGLIELTFKAINDTSFIQLDSIRIMNRTQNKEILLFWPDTTIVLQSELEFNIGDELLYIGYSGSYESGLLDSPEKDESYSLQFASKIPCPGTPLVEYEGKVYHTTQIFSQCWLKENLNVGTMIDGYLHQLNNGVIEKYCYDDIETNCTIYGGLYQWGEMMQYAIQGGNQGLCPSGWHVPDDEELKILDGSVDSKYGIGDPEWDEYYYRGFDAGKNLKAAHGWNFRDNGTDLFGFTGLPGGFRYDYGDFYSIKDEGRWWTSTEYDVDESWNHVLSHDSSQADHTHERMVTGYSIRCLRDE